jgi:hypothetical protein
MDALFSLILLLLIFKPVYQLIELMAEHARISVLERMDWDNHMDLKRHASMFKNIIASLNGCTTPGDKQRCIDDHTQFMEGFAKTIMCANRPRGLHGSVALVIMFQQRLFPTKSVPNQWMQEFADVAYEALMLCAHEAFMFGEIKSDEMIDSLSNSMYAFSRLHAVIRQERMKRVE